MKVFAEVFTKSLTKKGEELCGDSVEVMQSEDGIIAVMADGLGSGVKASILSTLTVRIASTMIKNRASIEEVVRTLINTLPVCRVRQVCIPVGGIDRSPHQKSDVGGAIDKQVCQH